MPPEDPFVTNMRQAVEATDEMERALDELRAAWRLGSRAVVDFAWAWVDLIRSARRLNGPRWPWSTPR